MFQCKLCKEKFEESGDAEIHIAYSHKLIIDLDHPNGLTRADFPPEFQGFLDEIDKKSIKNHEG